MSISNVERCFDSSREFSSFKKFTWTIFNFSAERLPCSIDCAVKIWGNMDMNLELRSVNDFDNNNAQLIKPFFSFNGANSKFPVEVQINSLRGGAKYDEEFAYPYSGPLKLPINDDNKFICVDNLNSFLENGALSLVVKVTIWFQILKRSSFVPLGNKFCGGSLTDFVFNVDGQEFYVHKAIVAAQSPVLLKMFSSHDFIEGRSSFCTLSDVSKNVFQEFLHFIYDGRFVSLDANANTVLELLKLAEKYAVDALKQICEVWLICDVTIENSHDLYLYANLYCCNELREVALREVKRKFARHNFAIPEKASPGDIEKALFHFRGLESWLAPNDNDMYE